MSNIDRVPMSRVIEFLIPTESGTKQARGVPMGFVIGDRKIKFVLQRNDENKPKWLTHYASGYKLGSLDDAAVELMCKTSTYHRFTKKQLAQFLIDKTVTNMGVEEVLKRLDSVPVINQTTKRKDRS
jgi:hypothetical protein